MRESVEVTLGGAAATRLMPTGGVGGAALTLWALRRSGLEARHAGRTLLTFLVVLYAVFLGAIAVAGTLLALGAAGAHGPLALTAVPAALAATGIAIPLVLGLRHRARAARGEVVAAPRPPVVCARARRCSARRSTRRCAWSPPATCACSARWPGGRSTPPCCGRCSTRSAPASRCWSSCSPTSSARPAT